MKKQFFSAVLVALFLIFAVRLFSLGILGLADPSEGRYAAVAQSMLLLGDFVTPWTFVKSIPEPFLGKPPLLFWTVAGSFRIFGMNEFGARFPSLLAALGSCLCVALFAVTFFNPLVAALSVLVLSTTILFFFLAGACLIDPLLTMAVTLTLTAFAICMSGIIDSQPKCSEGFTDRGSVRERYLYSGLFFIGLALGMLSKGPVAIVLVGLPIFAWLLLYRQVHLLKYLHWFSGMALFSAITVPWFWIAELRNPGFLNYFFIHENFLRYLVKDYGDRYGTGHSYPLGSIWIMLLIATLPWTPVMLFGASKPGRAICAESSATRWVVFAVLWGILPAAFFTFAKQVTAAYILPGLPGLAIFTGFLLYEGLYVRRSSFISRYLTGLSFLIPFCLLGIVIVGKVTGGLSIVSLASFFAVFGILWVAYRSIGVSAERKLFVVAFGLAVLFGMGAPNLKPIIDEESSANTLMAYLEEPIKNEPQVIGFFIKAPYSAFFYGRNELHDLHQVKTFTADEIDSAVADVFVVSEDQVKHLDRSKFLVTTQVGDWLIIKPVRRINET